MDVTFCDCECRYSTPWRGTTRLSYNKWEKSQPLQRKKVVLATRRFLYQCCSNKTTTAKAALACISLEYPYLFYRDGRVGKEKRYGIFFLSVLYLVGNKATKQYCWERENRKPVPMKK